MMGALDKAIGALQKNLTQYSQTLAAARSAVPLAQAYMARGSDGFSRAEVVLRGLLENNKQLTPASEECRTALFELGQLYFRTGRFEEALVRLGEWTERYPKDPRLGQVLFVMAESYRKSAALGEAQLASTQPQNASDQAARVAEKKARLGRAAELYDRVIQLNRLSPPETEVSRQQLKFAHFYRADCAFDLGLFDDAVKLYDVAAVKYQDDPSAVAAYVQIVNSYYAMGRKDEAKTANERAKWLLRKMPAEAFSDGSLALPRGHWEQWLKTTGEAGM
jgi:tetratricopeptide (TPR) repeat protein